MDTKRLFSDPCYLELHNETEVGAVNKTYGFEQGTPCILLKLNQVRLHYVIKTIIQQIILSCTDLRLEAWAVPERGWAAERRRDGRGSQEGEDAAVAAGPHQVRQGRARGKQLIKARLHYQYVALYYIPAMCLQMGNMVWMSCEGDNPADRENIGDIEYFPDPGIPSYYFPYKNSGHPGPVIFAHFKNPRSTYLQDLHSHNQTRKFM